MLNTFEAFEKKAFFEFEQDGDIIIHNIRKVLNMYILIPINFDYLHTLAGRKTSPTCSKGSS